MGNILNLFCGSEEQVIAHHGTLPPPKRQNLKHDTFAFDDAVEQPFVTDAVREARQDAGEYAEKRSRCMQQSQDAYKNGDGANAKQLSNEGKKWGKKIEEANAKAANLILAPQNVYLTGRIDLHGLFLEEAVEATNKFLDFWCGFRQCDLDEVIIITGAGHHSKTKDGPVIRPKVEQILRQRKLDYEAMHGNGAFCVYLLRRQ